MRLFSRTNAPKVYWVSLPLAVVVLDVGLGFTAILVVAGLLWTWGARMSTLSVQSTDTLLRLETISASHYVEKARWCLDRLGVPYREEPTAGVLGVFFTARLVPRLHVTIGPITSVIGGTAEISRYLFGKYAPTLGGRAAFLAADEEALELEARIDAYAFHVRRWIYFNALPERRIVLRLWGREDPSLPRWQRSLLALLYPVLRFFMTRALGVTAPKTQQSREAIEAFATEMEERLSDGRATVLGGELTFVDIAMAALSAPWVRCDNYGGGKIADVLVPTEQYPEAAKRDMKAWQERFPRLTAYVRRLYEEERFARAA